MAVPSGSRLLSMALTVRWSAVWSSVSGDMTSDCPWKITRPARSPSSVSRKSWMTSLAASRRVGPMPPLAICVRSDIEPDTSKASAMSMPSSGIEVMASPRCGRATATMSSATAAMRSAAGSQRRRMRQLTWSPCAAASNPRSATASTARGDGRRQCQSGSSASSGKSSSNQGAAKVMRPPPR